MGAKYQYHGKIIPTATHQPEIVCVKMISTGFVFMFSF